MRRSRRKPPLRSDALCSQEKRHRTQALMREAKKGIPDVALSAQSQASHQPASFAVGPERLMLRLGFDRYHRLFNRFGVM